MTKKEQILEMAKIADFQLFDLAGNADDVAKALYKAGYRKVEKVRRETAKVILQKWYCENKAKGNEQDYVLELAYAYGVEVEE